MRTYNVQDMSELFKKTPRTIKQDVTRRPWTLPPRIVKDGVPTLLWSAATVDFWLVDHEEKAPKVMPHKNF